MSESSNTEDNALSARTHELSLLVKKVREIEEAIIDAVGNDIDAIILDDGDVHVLRQAQKAILAAEEQRQLAEAAIRRSEARFRALIENSGDAITLVDAQGNILYLSPATERIFGYSLKEIKNMNRLDFVHPDDLLEAQLFFKELVQKPGTGALKARRMRHKDGHYLWVEGTISNLLADPNVQAMVSNFRDITDRKATEEKIREQASMLENATDAIIAGGLDQRISHWNRSAERVYGWTAAEAIGRLTTELFVQDTPVLQEAIQQVKHNGEWHGELSQTCKDGKELIVESRWTLLRDISGMPQKILAINTNVTERKKLEQQYARSQRLESIGTLAGGIAHDLNNVLTPILMAIELLSQSVESAEGRELIDLIGSSAKRGADMVGQVLSFARGLEGRKVEVQARHLLHDVEKIIRDTFPKKIAIHSSVAGDLWTWLGDPTQLHQVLLNLCVNARDAMPNGGSITLTAENVDLDQHYAVMNAEARPGPYVLLQVEDTGTGIPQNIIDKIFDPFFTTKEIGKGTGLGLSTSLAIIKSQGGFIRVYSEETKGTCFRIYLPADSVAVRAHASDELIELPRGSGELILIVDDETSILQITRQTLEAFGYRVLVAADGAEAVAIYAKRRAEIVLVLTDIMMPIMDGIALIQVLKKMQPNIRIIAASGITANENALKMVAIGVEYFLPKPYTADALLNILKKVLMED